MTIADTDVLIDFLAGKGEAATVERFLRSQSLRTTVITRFELLSGAKSPKQLARLQVLFAAIPALELDVQAADAAAAIRHELDRNGTPIGMADSLIAGIVTTNSADLLTRNRRHFERVPGLRLTLITA